MSIELLEGLLLAGVTVLIASQGWVMQQVHRINIAISAKHAEYDTRLDHQASTIAELTARVQQLERSA